MGLGFSGSDALGSLTGGGGFAGAHAASDYSGLMAKYSKGLYNSYDGYYKQLVEALPGMSQVPLSTYANEAGNAVAQNFDRTRGVSERNLQRQGVNPSSPRYASLQASLARAEAAARAGAMTSAVNNGRTANFSRGMSAGQLGIGMVGTALNGLGAAGNLAIGSGQLMMAAQDQQYDRFNDMMEYFTGKSLSSGGDGGGGGGGGGSGLSQSFAALFGA